MQCASARTTKNYINTITKEKHLVKIISIQSQSGGTGVTLTAAELALTAAAKGKRVAAVDTSPWRCLKDDIEDAGFHYLDDVRQLFKPLAGERWMVHPMPLKALFCYPESQPFYLAHGQDGQLVYALRKRVGEGDKAASRFWRVRQFLERHYDVMIVDVMNKDKRLMQLFYDVSDEVHLMLRDSRPHNRSKADWRRYIERETGSQSGPKVITHSDRNYIRGDVNSAGQSIALKPFIDAVQSSQGALTDAL
jgi:cellulose biosynthesis protein BcsQ